MRIHRVLIAVLTLILLSGCGAGAEKKAPPPRQAARYTIEDFMGNKRVVEASFSPDGKKILVSSNETGIFNAFAVPTDGGAPVQLTRSTTDAILTESYFPGDERFLYTQDQGGNELDHLFVQELDGTARDLTPGKKLKAVFGEFAQDGRSFFVLTNERDEKYFDVYEYATTGYDRKLVFKNTEGLDFTAASGDGRYLALTKTRTTTDSDVVLYDRGTQRTKSLTPHTGEMKNSAEAFSFDGTGLYLLTDDGSEFDYVVRYDLATGRKEVVDKPSWDVLSLYRSKGGKYLVVRVNNDARTEVKVYEASGMKPVPLPDVPAGELSSVTIANDETQLAFYVNANRMPGDLFVVSLSGGAARQLTKNLNPKIDPADLVDGQVVRFTSYDGVEIPGILYRPLGANPEAKVPGLVWVHGGPGGQSRVGYSGLIQYLVNHGYGIYAINNRGSSGYGKTFFAMDDRKHGEADLGDCISSKKMLVDTGWVDSERIGILGGSYGGYMVLAALTLAPDEFRVGIDLFGISNWVRTLESIPPWWESFREALYREMGDPKTDAERLRRISPLFNADKVTRPLMVLQGKNDPRVLKQESDDIVAAVKARGVPVEYVVFDDEGHGFVNTANEIRGNKAILEFLDKYLASSAN
jgi:dipeptidyl aminopeptidase/acylaminoacyl peptidase